MKVLFTAAGSIGSRHIKNLTDICNERNIPIEIDVLRKTNRVLPDEIGKLVHEELRDRQPIGYYDIGFITSETKAHYDEIRSVGMHCQHLFIEKPVFDNIEYDVKDIQPPDGSVYYVACPIRFSRYFVEIKKQVDFNEVYSARMIFSSYMPNWQKGRDYRKSFRCFIERGGGVDIDSLHEIDMMTALFGLPKTVLQISGKYSNLDMEACDLSTSVFAYNDKVVEMHLDYFGRVNNRRTELFCRDDVITIDYNERSVIKQVEDVKESYGADDQFYQDEMRYFLDLIQSEGRIENINPVRRAFVNLKLAKGCSLTEEDYDELL